MAHTQKGCWAALFFFSGRHTPSSSSSSEACRHQPKDALRSISEFPSRSPAPRAAAASPHTSVLEAAGGDGPAARATGGGVRRQSGGARGGRAQASTSTLRHATTIVVPEPPLCVDSSSSYEKALQLVFSLPPKRKQRLSGHLADLLSVSAASLIDSPMGAERTNMRAALAALGRKDWNWCVCRKA